MKSVEWSARMLDRSGIEQLVREFLIPGAIRELAPYGNGLINDTWLSRWDYQGVTRRFLHQRINQAVFSRPDQVMENISRVTRHMQAKMKASGIQDAQRRCLGIVPDRSGALCIRDQEGGYWRCYQFIEGATSLTGVHDPATAFRIGEALGRFHALLVDLPPPPLHEVIPGFHDMQFRYRQFDEAIEADPRGRKTSTLSECSILQGERSRGSILMKALRAGSIPWRTTHNDTKLDNILVDAESGEVLCLIDLDTVMQGSPLFDFGDLVRTLTAGCREDETDLSKVGFNLPLFNALLQGYCLEARSFLTKDEMALLGEAGRNLAQIMAVRFLADYLQGDRYYRVDRPDHNLDRCRNQLAFMAAMDARQKELAACVAEAMAAVP
jgi:Ser/Thr protein kinase RdoA (MazF antagonist)